jgi:hypothetical protein
VKFGGAVYNIIENIHNKNPLNWSKPQNPTKVVGICVFSQPLSKKNLKSIEMS